MSTVTPPVQNKSNYFIRHWRGEFSLIKSFWTNLILVPLGIMFICSIFVGGWSVFAHDFDVITRVYPYLAGIAFVLLIWGLVGVWRSSGHSLKAGTKFWPIVTRIYCVIMFIQIVCGVLAVVATYSGPLTPPHDITLPTKDGSQKF